MSESSWALFVTTSFIFQYRFNLDSGRSITTPHKMFNLPACLLRHDPRRYPHNPRRYPHNPRIHLSHKVLAHPFVARPLCALALRAAVESILAPRAPPQACTLHLTAVAKVFSHPDEFPLLFNADSHDSQGPLISCFKDFLVVVLSGKRLSKLQQEVRGAWPKRPRGNMFVAAVSPHLHAEVEVCPHGGIDFLGLKIRPTYIHT